MQPEVMTQTEARKDTVTAGPTESTTPSQMEEAKEAEVSLGLGEAMPTHLPRDWPKWKIWTHIYLVSLLALITNMGPTMCAPGIADTAREFGVTSSTVSTLMVTIYVLGLATGPLLASPISETHGRLPVYHTMNAVFFAFMIGTALSKTLAQFMVFRFLSGCAGGTPMALGGGTIADVTSFESRPLAMALFSLGPLTGPVLGPLIGGFVAASIGWRWTFWLLAICSGTVGLTCVALMRETNVEAHKPKDAPSTSRFSSESFIRPLVLLLTSPIVLFLSLYVALVFGLMYLLFTTFTSVFETQYNFSTSTSGLVYLGLGVSLLGSMIVFRVLGGRVQAWRMRIEGVDRPRPEYRLILMICFSPLVGVGLFIYGWTAEYKIHWIVPIIGTVFMGFGSFFIIMPTQLYLVELFGSKASASALAANNLLRFVSSTFLPLAGPQMYRSLGYGWGNTLLGLLAIAFVIAPILFYKYGERLRDHATAEK